MKATTNIRAAMSGIIMEAMKKQFDLKIFNHMW
jgi:hypothetical protein